MDWKVRACSSPEEMRAAVGPIWHYFGRSGPLDDQFERLYRWLERTDEADDLARGELSEPTLLTASRLIDAVLPAAYFVADPAMIAAVVGTRPQTLRKAH